MSSVNRILKAWKLVNLGCYAKRFAFCCGGFLVYMCNAAIIKYATGNQLFLLYNHKYNWVVMFKLMYSDYGYRDDGRQIRCVAGREFLYVKCMTNTVMSLFIVPPISGIYRLWNAFGVACVWKRIFSDHGKWCPWLTLYQPMMHICVMSSHKPIRIWGLILGVNTSYRLFCFFKLFPMAGKGLINPGVCNNVHTRPLCWLWRMYIY